MKVLVHEAAPVGCLGWSGWSFMGFYLLYLSVSDLVTKKARFPQCEHSGLRSCRLGFVGVDELWVRRRSRSNEAFAKRFGLCLFGDKHFLLLNSSIYPIIHSFVILYIAHQLFNFYFTRTNTNNAMTVNWKLERVLLLSAYQLHQVHEETFMNALGDRDDWLRVSRLVICEFVHSRTCVCVCWTLTAT